MKFRYLNIGLVLLFAVLLTNCAQEDPMASDEAPTLAARLSENPDFQNYLRANAEREAKMMAYIDGLSEDKMARISQWEELYGDVAQWMDVASEADRLEMLHINELGGNEAGAHLEQAMDAYPNEAIDAATVRRATALAHANGAIQLDVNSCGSQCSASANDTFNNVYMSHYGATGDWQEAAYLAGVAEAASYSGCMHGCMGFAG